MAVLATVWLLALASATTSYSRSADVERAVSAYATMQEQFQLDDGMFSETAKPGPHASAALWPFSQALGAALELAAVPGRGGRYQRGRAHRDRRA